MMRRIGTLAIVAILVAGCTPSVPTKPVVEPTSTADRTVPPGGKPVAFTSVASFTIGNLDNQVPMPSTCLAIRNVVDLGRLIARGGPQSLAERGIDFSASTLVSIFSGRGTSLSATRVDEYSDHVQVSYEVENDDVLLRQPVIFSPNQHITIPKTSKTITCVEL
jgi:PBP1b-binding outer membrane lipoprotein LpoB